MDNTLCVCTWIFLDVTLCMYMADRRRWVRRGAQTLSRCTSYIWRKQISQNLWVEEVEVRDYMLRLIEPSTEHSIRHALYSSIVRLCRSYRVAALHRSAETICTMSKALLLNKHFSAYHTLATYRYNSNPIAHQNRPSCARPCAIEVQH